MIQLRNFYINPKKIQYIWINDPNTYIEIWFYDNRITISDTNPEEIENFIKEINWSIDVG